MTGTPTLSFPRPDDFHVHLRDGGVLRDLVPVTARQFSRALVMPNLQPPVTKVAEAEAYRTRILATLPAGSHFDPLMALYLTDRVSRDDVRRAAEHPHIMAYKLYPRGATTNSDLGISDLQNLYPALEEMERWGIVLCVHGEVTDPTTDVFDREALFVERELAPLCARFPGLKVVLEHVTTQVGTDFVSAAPSNVAATITPQHLLFNRNALFDGGLHPHRYCLPVLKREADRRAVLDAATSGSPQFFLGTDSAPHARSRKEHACGCAGCFTAHAALELYATAFASVQRIDRLGDFASRFGAEFYGVPRNRGQVTLLEENWRVPESLSFGEEQLIPLGAGDVLAYRYGGVSLP